MLFVRRFLSRRPDGWSVCLSVAALVSLAVFGHYVFAQGRGIYLTISESGTRLIKVCVAGPAEAKSQPVLRTTREVLEFDITQSNRFRLVKAGPEVVRSARLGVRASRRDAIKSGRAADVFVVWDASRNGSGFTFKGRVIDARTQKRVFSKDFSVPMAQQRAVLHQFVDELGLMLSGRSGTAHCKIAFVSDWTGHKELFSADYDGHDMRQWTSLSSIVLSPAYSPRGDRIAFISFEDSGSNLSMLDVVSGRVAEVLDCGGAVASPVWSPDGKHIAVATSKSGNTDIYVFDVVSEKLTRLTHSKSIETSPTFAPNGRSIAFMSDRTGRPQIYVMSIDGSGLRRLTFEGKHNESPAWSPDGSLIAYMSLVGDAFQLRLIGPDGEGPYALAEGLSDCESPAWSPDGEKLAFSAKKGSSFSSMYLINRDGSGLTKTVSVLGNCTEPSWSP